VTTSDYGLVIGPSIFAFATLITYWLSDNDEAFKKNMGPLALAFVVAMGSYLIYSSKP
jgi:hypothetical protein